MDAARWSRVEDICGRAIELPEDERAAFVRETCGDDTDLASEVWSLLDSHVADPGFLEEPLARLGDEEPSATEEARIGPYRLVRALGRGGMGEVYLAEREGDDFRQTVAVKLIRRGLDSPEVLERFRQERRILARLRHPNIAGLLDGGTTNDGVPYVVMEYVDGRRLDRYCDEAGLDVTARLELVLSICAAVQHAHRSLVVHRDLKPGNVLVDAEGRPKLLDFGIGKLLDPWDDTEALLTRTGVRLLTPEYASPEQLRGQPVSTSSDVFSLGVITYELLTGIHPWVDAGSDPFALDEAIKSGPPRRPSEAVSTAFGPDQDTATRRRRALTGDLDTILLKALRPEPDRRYVSVEALADDLRRYLDERPVRARPDTFGYRTGKFMRRNRGAVVAAGAALLTLMASTVVVGLQNRRIVEESERVTAERDKALTTQGLLLEMFGAVGPEQLEGGEVTARALLDAQAERLSVHDDDPELQAQIQYVLADGYQRLGLIDDATSLAEAALDTRRELFGDEHPDVAQSLNLLGWIRREEGNADEAESLLRASIQAWRNRGPSGRSALSKALNDLGVLLNDRRDPEAITVLEEALAIRREAFGPLHRSVGITANNLAAGLWRAERRDEAARLQESAVEALESSLGPDHQRVWTARNNLMVFKGATQTSDSVVVAWADYTARAERVFGEGHRETAWGFWQWAQALQQSGPGPEGIDEALALNARAIEIGETAYGPDHPELAGILASRASILGSAGRYVEAVSSRERALAVYSDAYGLEHVQVGIQKRELAREWFAAGDMARGDAVLREAYDHVRRSLGPTSPYTLSDRISIGRRQIAADSLQRALDWLGATMATVDSLAEPHPIVLADSRLALAQILALTGTIAAADSLLGLVRTDAEERGGATLQWFNEVEGLVRGEGSGR